MNKSLIELKSIALGQTPIKKEIAIDGQKIEIYIKKLSYNSLEQIRKQEELSFSDFLIINSIVDQNGDPIFTHKEVKNNLIVEYYRALSEAAAEVSLGKILTEYNSMKPTKSGSNSSLTESVEEPLKKPKEI